MSGSLIGGAVGAVIGYVVSGFNPAGAMYGFQIGAFAGGVLFPGQLPDQTGPRLSDLKVQVSTFGTAIPIVYGLGRLSGNVIWSTDLVEHSHTQESGGKGGGPSQSTTTYTYTVSCAVLLCEGPIVGVRRIWADALLIYDVSESNTSATWFGAGAGVPRPRIYLGTETQMPDPSIEAALGAGNVPAYRGSAYVVFQDFPLEKFGNRTPNFSFEVVGHGAKSNPVIYYRDAALQLDGIVYNPLMNEVWVTNDQSFTTDPVITRLNADTGAVVGSIVLNAFVAFWTPLVYSSQQQSVFAYDGVKFYRFDASTGVKYYATAQADMQGLRVNPFTGHVYVVNSNGITEVNGVTGGVYRTYSFGFSVYDLVFSDDVTAWVTSNTSTGSANKNLYRVGLLLGDVTAMYGPDTNALTNLAYDHLRDMVWVMRNSANVLGFDIASGSVAYNYTLPVSPWGTVNTFIYDPFNDYLWSSRSNNIAAVSPADGSTQYSYTGLVYSPGGMTPSPNALFASGINPTTFYGEVIKLPGARISISQLPLSDILTDLSEKTDQLTAADIDVSAQTAVMVDGYVIGRQTSARSCIEQLQLAYFFDPVESDNKVKFVNRGGGSALTIPDDDLAAFKAFDTAVPDDLSMTRVQEVELPIALNLTYAALGADLQTGNQQSRRLAPMAGDAQTMSVPLALSDSHAKQIVDRAMFNLWTARTRFEFTTTQKYAKLEPTDVVTVKGRTIRIEKRDEQDGVIHWQGSEDDPNVYSQNAAGIVTSYTPQTIASKSGTALALLDIPLLRDQDDGAGFYAAATGYLAGWPGAVLFKSSDSGVTWAELTAFTSPAAMGRATTALAASTVGNVFDYSKTVTVAVMGGRTLSSATELAVLNGTNAAMLGNELIQYVTATLNADGTYTLGGLLRGRKGTEWAEGSHAVGDLFVALTTSTVQRMDAQTAEIGLARSYKAVTIGTTLDGAVSQDFTDNAVGLKPLSPVQLAGSRDGSNNLTLTWVRRTRVGGEWRDKVDASLGETTESYDVEIWNSTYTTLKRTFAGLTTPTASYTAAQQTTDFGATQSTVYVRVYQNSATVGRGYKLEGTA